MRAGQLKYFLQVNEVNNGRAMVDVGQQSKDAVRRAHSTGVAEHMWMGGPHVLLEPIVNHSLSCFGHTAKDRDGP